MNSSDEPGVEMENRDLEIGSSDVDDEPMEYGKEHETDDEVDHSGTGSRSDLPASDGELTTRAKFIPVTLAFKNLFYSVKVRKGKNPFHKKHKKTLLKDLHGELRPGEVTAIMGPSGTPPPQPPPLSYHFLFFSLRATTRNFGDRTRTQV
jgi:ABC-type glutathione transport system ATPase component